MSLVIKKKSQSTSRWIYPFPETMPSVAFEVRALGKSESIRIHDKHDIRGGSGLLMGQIFGVLEDTVKAAILDWKGIEDEDGKPVPVNDKTKVTVMLENEYEHEGEQKTLWQIVDAMYAAELEAERKN